MLPGRPPAGGRRDPRCRRLHRFFIRGSHTAVMITDTIIRVITGAIWLETLLIIASVIVSWLPVPRWHPLVRALHAVVDPVLRPFKRILPPIAGFDFSPLLAIIVLRAISSLVSSLGLGGPVSVVATLVGVVAQLVLAVLLFLALLVGLR